MVSIVLPKNSLTDLINAGLTVRYYAEKGESSKICLIDEDEKEQFWKEPQKYADEDHSLIILNFPVSSDETLKSITMEPYDYSIIYVPSETIVFTPETKKILSEKGVITMPQRSIYKCFPGDYSGKVEKRWMELNKIASFEEETAPKDPKIIDILKGLIKTMENEPVSLVSNIAKDNETFFEKIGKSEPEIRFTTHITNDHFEAIVLAEGQPETDTLQTAFMHSVLFRKFPISVKGEKGSVVLTDSPTFAGHVFNEYKVKPNARIKLGNREAIFTKNMEDVEMGAVVGQLSQKNIRIKIIGNPSFFVRKTLIRRLIGGRGPGGRFYRGIKDQYPGIELKNDFITMPRNAVEIVVGTLRETGTKYEIVE